MTGQVGRSPSFTLLPLLFLLIELYARSCKLEVAQITQARKYSKGIGSIIVNGIVHSHAFHGSRLLCNHSIRSLAAIHSRRHHGEGVDSTPLIVPFSKHVDWCM